MNTAIVAAGTVGLTLLAGLVAAIIWLSKSREKQVKAETNLKNLTTSLENRDEADAIMAEPVADESAWLAATDERLRDGGE